MAKNLDGPVNIIGTQTQHTRIISFPCSARYLNKTDNLALLLDYDGTLSPLASHPNLTVMEPESEEALRELATLPNIYLAIISGRGADNAREKVNIDNITYAGNHGLEILFGDKTHYHHEVDQATRENFTKMVAELEKQVSHAMALSPLFIIYAAVHSFIWLLISFLA